MKHAGVNRMAQKLAAVEDRFSKAIGFTPRSFIELINCGAHFDPFNPVQNRER